MSRETNRQTKGSNAMLTQSAISEAAAALGRKGGASRSAAKVAAVRENGRKGGRPKGSKNKAK